jgi:hypothetical protein
MVNDVMLLPATVFLISTFDTPLQTQINSSCLTYKGILQAKKHAKEKSNENIL